MRKPLCSTAPALAWAYTTASTLKMLVSFANVSIATNEYRPLSVGARYSYIIYYVTSPGIVGALPLHLLIQCCNFIWDSVLVSVGQ